MRRINDQIRCSFPSALNAAAAFFTFRLIGMAG
jgi:hypothetical protein